MTAAVQHAPDTATASVRAIGADTACERCGRTCPGEQSHECPACGRPCAAEARSAEPRGRLTPARRAGADAMARVVGTVMADVGCWQTWADRMGIARQVAARFGAPDGPRVALGDIALLPADVAVAVLSAAIQRIRGRQDAESLGELEGDLGQLVEELDRGLAAGRIDPACVEAVATETSDRLNFIASEARARRKPVPVFAVREGAGSAGARE